MTRVGNAKLVKEVFVASDLAGKVKNRFIHDSFSRIQITRHNRVDRSDSKSSTSHKADT